MLMRTDPFRELERFAQSFAGTPSRPASMPMDAYRRGEEFIAEFDLPGLDSDSIDVTVEKNVLTVTASRRRRFDDESNVIATERQHGTFVRQLFLGDTLDTDHIDASYADGVLTLRLPISEKAKPRRIEIAATQGSSASIDAKSRESERVSVNA